MAAYKFDPAMEAFEKRFHKECNALYNAIKRYDSIVVFRHQHPDFDALGSQMGLVTFLKDNFPEKEIHFVGDHHPTFTPRIYPLPEELPLAWFKEHKFLSIILDVGDHERIADPRYKMGGYIAKIDHHPCKKEIAKRATIVDLEAGSAAELVADFCFHFKGTKMSAEAATYFYSAIVGDTGRFLFSSTSSHTFAVAEELLKCGIDIAKIYQKMYEKSQTSLRTLAYALSHYDITADGVAYYVISDEALKVLGIANDQGKEHVNIFSNIEGINAWCSITEDADPKDPCWRISIRSKEKDISGIANQFGGGGHAQASGARIDTLDDLPRFLDALGSLFR